MTRLHSILQNSTSELQANRVKNRSVNWLYRRLYGLTSRMKTADTLAYSSKNCQIVTTDANTALHKMK